MYKILILTAKEPMTVTGVDLYSDEQLKDAIEHYMKLAPGSIFGIVKGVTISYLDYEQYSTRFNLLQRCGHINFDFATIKKG